MDIRALKLHRHDEVIQDSSNLIFCIRLVGHLEPSLGHHNAQSFSVYCPQKSFNVAEFCCRICHRGLRH